MRNLRCYKKDTNFRFGKYRIYSINRPGRLLNFVDLESGRLFEAGRLLNFHNSQKA